MNLPLLPTACGALPRRDRDRQAHCRPLAGAARGCRRLPKHDPAALRHARDCRLPAPPRGPAPDAPDKAASRWTSRHGGHGAAVTVDGTELRGASKRAGNVRTGRIGGKRGMQKHSVFGCSGRPGDVGAGSSPRGERRSERDIRPFHDLRQGRAFERQPDGHRRAGRHRPCRTGAAPRILAERVRLRSSRLSRARREPTRAAGCRSAGNAGIPMGWAGGRIRIPAIRG